MLEKKKAGQNGNVHGDDLWVAILLEILVIVLVVLFSYLVV